MLFDRKDVIATWQNSYSESEFDALSKSPQESFGRVRNLIEDWVERYLVKNINELLPRLRSRNDSVFRSAFFELYLHELLLRLGLDIEVHPKLSQVGTRPEFLVSSKGEGTFYMEATCEFGPLVKSSIEKIISTVVDYFNNKLDSPDFYLSVNFLSSSTADPPKGKWLKSLNTELSKLSPDSVEYGTENKPLSFLMMGNGWEVHIEVLPRPKQERGRPGVKPILVRNIPASWGEIPNYIENAFRKKHETRYGKLKTPYVIAINIWDPFYGRESLIKRELLRCWSRPVGKPAFSGVSGALISDALGPWNISRKIPILWHNPRAKNALATSIFTIPQKAILEEGRIENLPGKSPQDIFGLPDNWPWLGEDP